MGPRAGFSLLEMLVALALLAVLLAGMGQVLFHGLESNAQTFDRLHAQRTLRLAQAALSDDLRMMGYFFPPPALRPLPLGPWGAGRLGGFRLEPDQPVWELNPDTSQFCLPADAPVGQTDVLTFVLDAPMRGKAWLVEAYGPAPSSDALRVCMDETLPLETGDLAWVGDDHFEVGWVKEDVVLGKGQPGEVLLQGPRPGAAWRYPHACGARIEFVRPLRVVRLGLVHLPLEDAAHRLVPCLVRFETAYPTDQTEPPWAEGWGRKARWGEWTTVLAENVTGFQVDVSLDGRWPGIRGRDEAATRRNLDDGIQRQYGRAQGSLDPLWFRHYPALIKVELETQSPSWRGSGRPSHSESETWIFTPRNFGLEALR